MATSSAMSTSNQYVKYTITVDQISQNVTANTSSVRVSVRFYRTNIGYTTYGSGTVYCKINGTTYSASVSPDQRITENGIVLFSRTVTISHNTDGTKTLATSAWISLNTPLTSSEQTYNQALTTIARATTPTVSLSTVTLGSSVTISTPRASSDFTHTLRYGLGTTSGTIATNVATSTSWTVPTALSSSMPNSTSGVLTIYCDTYKSTTKIGTKSVNITVNVPSTTVPTITSINVVDTVTEIATKFDAFIKNHSIPRIGIVASGSGGSSIVSYVTTLCGNSFNGSSFVVPTVSLCETVNISTTVKDSRGRSTTNTRTISVLDYSYPSVSKFKASRCDSDGTLNDEGSYIKIEFAFSIVNLNNRNDKSYKISYKETGDSEYTTLTSSTSYYNRDTTIVSSNQFDVDKTYVLKLEVEDYFRKITREIEIPTAFTLVDYHSSGKGIAFGKVAENTNLLDVGLPAIFRSSARLSGGLTHDLPVITSDLDTVNVSGFYYAGSYATNRPANTNGYLEVFVFDADTIYQRYTTYTGTTFERIKGGGTWGRWCGKYSDGIWTYDIKLNGEIDLYAKIPMSNLSITTALSTWFRSGVITGSSYEYPVELTTEPVVNMLWRTSNGYGGLVWVTNEGTVSAPPDFYIIRPTSASGVYGYVDIQVKGKWR